MRIWLVGSVAAWVVHADGAHGQLAKKTSARVDNCAIARPWANPGGELLSPKTASATYHALSTHWSIDSAATIRDLTSFLTRTPDLLGAIASAAQACPKTGCVCPRLPNLAQTSQMAQTFNLVTSYRLDPAGTSAATAVFLSQHLWLMARLRDSLARRGTKAQRSAIARPSAVPPPGPSRP